MTTAGNETHTDRDSTDRRLVMQQPEIHEDRAHAELLSCFELNIQYQCPLGGPRVTSDVELSTGWDYRCTSEDLKSAAL